MRRWTYPLHTDIITTTFWCGERASSDNGQISNVASAWDGKWMRHFGGEDAPRRRSGYLPRGFTPRENPFYVALPYNDFDGRGRRKRNARALVYWASSRSWAADQSMVKNRWVQVTHGARTCYGQWEDVGPYHKDDEAYVFGAALPKNKVSPRAGLDLSPALRDCLGIGGLARTEWRFVEHHEVPRGPWTRIVTTFDRLR